MTYLDTSKKNVPLLHTLKGKVFLKLLYIQNPNLSSSLLVDTHQSLCSPTYIIPVASHALVIQDFLKSVPCCLTVEEQKENY